jgi:hypothetical protein
MIFLYAHLIFVFSSCQTVDCKYPLHLVIGNNSSSSSGSSSSSNPMDFFPSSPAPSTNPRSILWRKKMTELLLKHSPHSAYWEINEEVHYLRLLTDDDLPETPSQLQQQQSSSSSAHSQSSTAPTTPHSPSTNTNNNTNNHNNPYYHYQEVSSQDNDLSSIRILIGQEQYKMETEVLRWSPMEKVMDSSDSEVNNVFLLYFIDFTG